MSWLKSLNQQLESYFGNGLLAYSAATLLGVGLFYTIASALSDDRGSVPAGIGLLVLAVLIAGGARIRHLRNGGSHREQ